MISFFLKKRFGWEFWAILGLKNGVNELFLYDWRHFKKRKKHTQRQFYRKWLVKVVGTNWQMWEWIGESKRNLVVRLLIASIVKQILKVWLKINALEHRSCGALIHFHNSFICFFKFLHWSGSRPVQVAGWCSSIPEPNKVEQCQCYSRKNKSIIRKKKNPKKYGGGGEFDLWSSRTVIVRLIALHTPNHKWVHHHFLLFSSESFDKKLIQTLKQLLSLIQASPKTHHDTGNFKWQQKNK